MGAGELSRGQFLRRGAAVLGGVAGLGLADPLAALAKGKGSGVPNPIPGGFDANFHPVPSDPVVHVLPPGIGFEMSTITDFNGVVGASEIRGTAHGSDGSVWDFDTDMRFMQGRYVDTSGRMQHGTFAFIWIDLFAPGHVGDPSFQEHDFEPGIASNGLFWTIAVSNGSVEAHHGHGKARLRGHNVAVTDYHDIFNAIFGGGPTPLPSHVSFDVRWSGHGHPQRIRDATYGFVGEYVAGPAKIDFVAKDDTGNVLFRSDRHGQYNPTPDQGGAGSPAVGRERNGVFFH